MWLSGRASPCQGEGRGFESRHPLQFRHVFIGIGHIVSRIAGSVGTQGVSIVSAPVSASTGSIGDEETLKMPNTGRAIEWATLHLAVPREHEAACLKVDGPESF